MPEYKRLDTEFDQLRKEMVKRMHTAAETWWAANIATLGDDDAAVKTAKEVINNLDKFQQGYIKGRAEQRLKEWCIKRKKFLI